MPHDHDHSHDDGGHEHSHGDDDHDHTHDHHHHDAEEVGVAVLTVSSSRSLDGDSSGDAIESLLAEAPDAEMVARYLVDDSREEIGTAVERFVDESAVDAVVTTGGTGITSDDVTVEALEARFEKELPGFGEVFRRRSEADIGMRIVATRATAGVVEDTVVFALPGSEAAARLGTSDIILPVVAHLVGLARQ